MLRERPQITADGALGGNDDASQVPDGGRAVVAELVQDPLSPFGREHRADDTGN